MAHTQTYYYMKNITPNNNITANNIAPNNITPRYNALIYETAYKKSVPKIAHCLESNTD